MTNYYVKNTRTGKKVKESGCESKAEAKLIRDKFIGGGHNEYCVTRSDTNLASKAPHGRPVSGGTLHVFSTQI